MAPTGNGSKAEIFLLTVRTIVSDVISVTPIAAQHSYLLLARSPHVLPMIYPPRAISGPGEIQI